VSVILNARGTPEPSPDVQARLARIGGGLHLRYIEGVAGVWAICRTWPGEDHRRARIQAERMDPDAAFDILGYLPMACPPDEAGAYVERSLRAFPASDVRRIADAVLDWNTRVVPQQMADAALGDILDMPDPSASTRTRGRRVRIDVPAE